MYMYESESNYVYCNKFYSNRMFDNGLDGFRCCSEDCVSGTEVNFNTINARAINGDGDVELKDLVLVIRAFGSHPSHPRWNQWANANVDGKIDLIELVIILRNSGETYPYP